MILIGATHLHWLVTTGLVAVEHVHHAIRFLRLR